jgi:tetratricopeptide (TPR) repeat protein
MGLRLHPAVRLKVYAVATITICLVCALAFGSRVEKPALNEKLLAIDRMVRKGDLQKALEQSQLEVESILKIAGSNSRELTQALYQQANILAAQGHTQESFDLLQKTVATEVKTRGSESIIVAEGLINIAELELKLGKEERALGFSQKAVQILDTKSGARAAKERGRALALSAELNLQSKNCRQAVVLADQGVATFQGQVKDSRAIEQRLYAALGRGWACLEDFEKAQENLKAAVSIARRTKDVALPELLVLQGESLCQLGRCKHGEKLKQQAIRLAEKMHPDGGEQILALSHAVADSQSNDEIGARAQLARENIATAIEAESHFEDF